GRVEPCCRATSPPASRLRRLADDRRTPGPVPTAAPCRLRRPTRRGPLGVRKGGRGAATRRHAPARPRVRTAPSLPPRPPPPRDPLPAEAAGVARLPEPEPRAMLSRPYNGPRTLPPASAPPPRPPPSDERSSRAAPLSPGRRRRRPDGPGPLSRRNPPGRRGPPRPA